MSLSDLIRVLHIDDEPSISEEIRELLALRQIDCVAAKNISIAREILLKEPSRRIVIVDFHMPGITGSEVIETLQHEFDGDLTFIVLTGDDGQLPAVESLRAAAFDFLRKPADAKLLAHTVKRAHERLKSNEPFKIRTRNFFSTLPDLSARLRQKEDDLRSAANPAGRSAGNDIRSGSAVGPLIDHAREARQIMARAETLAELPALESAVGDAKKILDVVGLAMGRQGSNRHNVLELHPSETASLARNIAESVTRVAHARDFKVQIQVERELPSIRADAALLGRAIEEIANFISARTQQGTCLQLAVSSANDQLLITLDAKFAAGVRFPADVIRAGVHEVLRSTASNNGTMRLIASKLIIELHGGSIRLTEPSQHSIQIEIRLPAETSQSVAQS